MILLAQSNDSPLNFFVEHLKFPLGVVGFVLLLYLVFWIYKKTRIRRRHSIIKAKMPAEVYFTRKVDKAWMQLLQRFVLMREQDWRAFNRCCVSQPDHRPERPNRVNVLDYEYAVGDGIADEGPSYVASNLVVIETAFDWPEFMIRSKRWKSEGRPIALSKHYSFWLKPSARIRSQFVEQLLELMDNEKYSVRVESIGYAVLIDVTKETGFFSSYTDGFLTPDEIFVYLDWGRRIERMGDALLRGGSAVDAHAIGPSDQVMQHDVHRAELYDSDQEADVVALDAPRGVAAPEDAMPAALVPEVVQPAVAEPEVLVSEIVEPEFNAPNSRETEVSDPKVSDSKLAQPELVRPEVLDAEISDAEILDADAIEPVMIQDRRDSDEARE